MLNAISDTCQTLLASPADKVAYMESFKQRMKRIRVRAGYRSQGEAADAIGCERGTVSMWEAPSSNVQKVSSDLLFATARAYKVRPDWLNNLKSSDDGWPWEGGDYRVEPEPEVPSQVLGLDLAKLAAAQKFLEDLFRGEGIKFVASEQTMLLAAVYQELVTDSEPNIVEMAGRFGKKVRGQDERQGAIGSSLADDREGAGERGEKARVKSGGRR